MKNNTLYIIYLLFFATACTSHQQEETTSEEHFIEITKEQFKQENMAFGKAEKMLFEKTISVSGRVITALDGKAIIHVPVEGFVNNLYVQMGQKVKAGDPLFSIKSNSLTDLQLSLAASSVQLKQLEANYTRIETLYNDSIKTESDFLDAESKYKTELSNYLGLKLRISQTGLNTEAIEAGNYYPTYTITAPIEGQLTNIDVSLGQFVDVQQRLGEIVDTKKLLLQLSVFEQYSLSVKPGQKVLFRTLEQKGEKSLARITSISNKLDSKTNAFTCLAILTTPHTNAFKENQLISAEITISADSVMAVPQSALVTSDNKSYVYSLEKEIDESYFLSKTSVNTGRVENNFIETAISTNKPILLKGAYNVSL